MSSPVVPSPRVAPSREFSVLRRSRVMDTPSIFGSRTYSTVSPGNSLRTRLSNSRSSSMLYVLSSDIIGTAWRTGLNSLSGWPPTRWVGESGVTRSGNCSSRFFKLRVELVVLEIGNLGLRLDVVEVIVAADSLAEVSDSFLSFCAIHKPNRQLPR